MEINTCNYQNLGLDQACTIFAIVDNSNFSLYTLISDCISCPFTKIFRLIGEKNTSLFFNSAKSQTWRIFNGDNPEIYRLPNDTRDFVCELKPNLGQNGVYFLTIDNSNCKINTVKEPNNSYTPIAVLFSLLLCIMIIVSLSRIGLKYWQKKKSSISNTERNGERPTAKRRIQSIDTFRGISILMMIFVNNGAGNYVQLEHAAWDGLFMGDLVFPSFIWIMGVCIPIALTSQLSRGTSRLQICGAIVKRSFLLFFIGVCLNTIGTSSQLEDIRIFGVLQRFGVAYLIVAITYVLLSKRESAKIGHGFLAEASDCLHLLPQWIVISIVVTGHCIITFGLNVPGCPKGYLGPGGRHKYGDYFNCTGGAAGYIDRLVLGTNHMYQHSVIQDIYGSQAFDPEGILGCLTTIFQTFLGVQTGKILRVHKSHKSRIVRWMILAIIYGFLGAVLHFSRLIPINKNLWSISFVLLTTGFSLILLTASYILIDVLCLWNGAPFRIPGMNALVMYIGHQMCYQIFPFHWKYGAMDSHTWKTISCLWDVILWTTIAYVLHRKRIYISL